MKRDINNEKGFTLVEVLVAVFLLAVGMMSAASMQLTAISGNKFSKDTSLAIELAEEMIDRIRINGGRVAHNYNGIDTSGACSGSDPFLGDCIQWKARIEDRSMGLGGSGVGKVTVTNDVPTPFTATIEVEVRWSSGSIMGRDRIIKLRTIKGTGLWTD